MLTILQNKNTENFHLPRTAIRQAASYLIPYVVKLYRYSCANRSYPALQAFSPPFSKPPAFQIRQHLENFPVGRSDLSGAEAIDVRGWTDGEKGLAMHRQVTCYLFVELTSWIGCREDRTYTARTPLFFFSTLDFSKMLHTPNCRWT